MTLNLATVILDALVAIEEASGFENDLLASVLQSAAAIEIDAAVPYRDIREMIVPGTAMNFITMAEAVDVVLAVNGPRRAARDSDGAARTSWADHLDILESRDIAGIGTIDQRLERERSLPVRANRKNQASRLRNLKFRRNRFCYLSSLS